MIVSEYDGDRLSIFDIRGQKIRTFGSRGGSPDQMLFPAGIATDDAYVQYLCEQYSKAAKVH